MAANNGLDNQQKDNTNVYSNVQYKNGKITLMNKLYLFRIQD